MDLNNSMEPINVMVNIPDFMTFAGAPNLSFTLTELLGGYPGRLPRPAADGRSELHARPVRLYNLNNQTAMSSTAGFTVNGYVVDTNNPGVQTPFSGIFTTQFANESLQQVVQTIVTGGTLDATYSAEFITTPVTGTPEPGTMFTLLAGGLLMLGIGTFGKRIQASRRA